MGRVGAPLGAEVQPDVGQGAAARVLIVPRRVARDRELEGACEPAMYGLARSAMLGGAQGPLTEVQHAAASAQASVDAVRTVAGMPPDLKRRIRPRSPVRRVAVVVHRVERAPVVGQVAAVPVRHRPVARERRPSCGARRRRPSSSPKASGDSSGEPGPGEPPGASPSASPTGGVS